MSNHIAALSRSCFFHLRQLRLFRQSLTPEAMNTLVQAFVTTRLDSCNSVLVGICNQLLQRMQVIQNATARFITGVRRFEHMTPVLRNLHWLPIWHRIKFKTAILVLQMSSWHGSTIPSIILHTGHISEWTIQLAIRHNSPTHCATYKDSLRQP